MNNLKSFILFLFLISFCTSALFAQKVGTTSMQFLKVMPVARATAMGDAYVTLATGADAVFWNPSGLAISNGKEFSINYMSWILDTKLGALSFAMPFENYGSFGVSVQYVDYGSMDEAVWMRPYIKNLETPGLTGRTFHPFAFVGGISYAKQLTDKFSTGVSIKYAYESLYDGHAINTMTSQGVYEDVKTWGKGLLFDFGMRYNTGYRSIQVAIAAQNFGADIVYAKDASPVPLQFRWGISADLIGKDPIWMKDEANRLTLAFDLFQPNDYAQQEHVGLEYVYQNILALRAGYKFNYDSEGLTLGIGLKQTISGIGISFDYSYGSLANYLGEVHRLSLGAAL